jgi:hypothetical protein
MVIQVCSRHIRASEFWEAWFRRSLDHPPEVPWESAVKLTAAERRTIRASVQEFQLGEQSEGHHLKHAAREYARRSGDAAYSRATELFVREEQHHAALLGRFMDLAGIERVRHTFVDSVFRRLRRFAGLETSICVLLTAEVIAKVYYRALLAATASPALLAICRRILQDEAHHVEFQSERLAILRRNRARWRIAAAVAAQRLLFAGSVAVVWLRHSPVLRSGNDSFPAYWRDCHREFRESLVLMDPAHYAGKALADVTIEPPFSQ